MEGLDKIEKLVLHLKEYAETKADLIALNIQDRLSSVLSSIASVIIICVLTVLTLLFVSIGVAIWLGQICGSPSIGFFYVAGFYLLITILVICFRKQLIKIPVINFLLKKINFHEKD